MAIGAMRTATLIVMNERSSLGRIQAALRHATKALEIADRPEVRSFSAKLGDEILVVEQQELELRRHAEARIRTERIAQLLDPGDGR
jgi:hypothetical protein